MRNVILILGLLCTTGICQANDSKDVEKFVTEMDFDSAAVDGKMKAPSGFYLQRRNKQSIQSMVKLRSDFRDRLRSSKSAVKAMVK